MRLSALLLVPLFSSSVALALPGVLPGEGYTFKLAIGPIEGARARMAVGMPTTKDGRTHVAVRGEAETLSIARLVAPMDASYLLTMDTGTLLPAGVTSLEKGAHDVTYHQKFAGQAVTVDVEAAPRTLHAVHVLSRPARDPLSAYFALRTMPLPDKQIVSLDVLDGPILWRARLEVIGREDLALGGTMDARPPVRTIHLAGSLQRIDDAGHVVAGRKSRTIAVWLSDEPTRILERVSFESDLGRANLELTSYIAPPRNKGFAAPSQPPPGISLE